MDSNQHPAPSDKYIIESVSNALNVLKFFMQNLSPARYYSLTELKKEMPEMGDKLFRYLKTLQAAGFIETDQGGKKYKIGHELLYLSHRYMQALAKEHDKIRQEVNQFTVMSF